MIGKRGKESRKNEGRFSLNEMEDEEELDFESLCLLEDPFRRNVELILAAIAATCAAGEILAAIAATLR